MDDVVILKKHFQVHKPGSPEAREQWKKEGLIPDKVKLCDGLMLKKGREYDLTEDTDYVNCEKCLKKIESWH